MTTSLAAVFGILLAVAVGAGLVGVVWSAALWWGQLWTRRPWSRRGRLTQAYLEARGLAATSRFSLLAATDLVSAIVVLSLLLGGAWQFGRAWRVQAALDAGCAQAAQYLTQHPDDPAAATALVRAAAEPVLGAEPASQVTVTIWRAAGEVAVR
ncbi:MAG: hypothetical protein KKB13_19470, partial [Chloroflexi bacterium]|nr:hypothetical protein [Chloroflexota bacterium]